MNFIISVSHTVLFIIVKPRMLRWDVHVARMEQTRNTCYTEFRLENLLQDDQLKDQGGDVNIILQ
jgi:hypothetical protein